MLRIVRGRPGTGKTTWLLEEAVRCYRKEQESGTPRTLFFLVPEQYTLQCERDLCGMLGNPGLLGIEVLSLDRLAQRVLDEGGGRTRVPLDGPGKRMLLGRVFRQAQPDLSVCRRSSRGFLDALSSLLEDLRRARIPLENLFRAAAEVEDPFLAAKMADIAALAGGYEAEMAGRFLDREEAYDLLRERIGGCRSLSGQVFFVDGFPRLSQQGLAVLTDLLHLGNEVSLALPWDDQPAEGSLFSESAQAVRTLTAYAREAAIPVEDRTMTECYRDPEIAFLNRNLFAFPHQVWPEVPGKISVWECDGREEEVWRILARIEEMVEREGYAYREIAVVCGDLSAYRGLFSRLCRQFRIPCFVDDPDPLRDNRFIAHVLLSLEAAASRPSLSLVRALLATGFTGMDQQEREILENALLARGTLRDALGTPFSGSPGPPEGAEEARRRLGETLSELGKDLEAARSIREQAGALWDYLEESGARQTLEAHVEDLEAARDFAGAARYRQAWPLLAEVLDQLVRVLGDDPADPGEFRRLLQDGVEARGLSQIPTGLDQVLIGSLERSRTHTMRAMFVPGCNEGVLPPGSADPGLIGGREAELLQRFQIELGREHASRFRREKVDLLLALGKPQDTLVLSYPRGSQAGETLPPSPLMGRIRRIFPRMPADPGLPEGAVTSLERLPRLRERAGRTVRDCLGGAPGHAGGLPVLRKLRERGDTDFVEALLQAAFDRDPGRVLSPEATRRVYGEAPRMSISRLEAMARCPFAHFVSYGLRPELRPEPRVEHLALGSFFHDCLYRYGRILASGGRSWVELEAGERRRFLEQALEESLTGGDTPAAVRTSPLLFRFRRMVRESLEVLTGHLARGEFRPVWYEAAFGPGRLLPPVEIETPGGTRCQMAGSIDRVDLWQDRDRLRVRLLDYKSGSRRFDYAAFFHGLSLQLAIYLLALEGAAAVLGVPAVDPAGAFYFPIAGRKAEAGSPDPGTWEEYRRELFRMDGLCVREPEILRGMDREGGRSPVIRGLRYNRDGTPARNAALISREELRQIGAHARALGGQLAGRILEGQVGVHPARVGTAPAPCGVCDYPAMCFREEGAIRYRFLEKKKAEEVRADLAEMYGADPDPDPADGGTP